MFSMIIGDTRLETHIWIRVRPQCEVGMVSESCEWVCLCECGCQAINKIGVLFTNYTVQVEGVAETSLNN